MNITFIKQVYVFSSECLFHWIMSNELWKIEIKEHIFAPFVTRGICQAVSAYSLGNESYHVQQCSILGKLHRISA